MIFETLNASAERGELMLVDGGMCHWHLRRDGQLTIREIISTKRGAGSLMLRRLEATPGAAFLVAKCPANLPANEWYQRRGFHVARAEWTKSGRMLLVWQKSTAQTARRPNAGQVEVIYCADGNPRLAQIALDAGMLYGARMPGSVGFRPYFIDQEWKNPDRVRYMEKLAECRPHIATVLDLERWQQLDEVLSWAEEAAQYARVVVIIPKAHGIIAELPRTISGARVRLGYSVPTRYGGTTVGLHEFEGWPVHLLGGSPERQLDLYHKLRVVSVDTNYTQKLAMSGQYWIKKPLPGYNNRHWPTFVEAGEPQPGDAPYEAFRRSCVNVMQAWRDTAARERIPATHDAQLHLWHPRELETMVS